MTLVTTEAPPRENWVHDLAIGELATSHTTLKRISRILTKITQAIEVSREDVARILKHMDTTLASAETSLETLMSGETPSEPAPAVEDVRKVIAALPGPLHDMPPDKAVKARKKARKTSPKTAPKDRSSLPAHLQVPHTCPGVKYGCTKGAKIYGNGYKGHEKTCEFLKKGLAKRAEKGKITKVGKGSKKSKAAA
jgi:hypothetical protein